MPLCYTSCNDRYPYAILGAAAQIIRANPFSAILAHCQLTFSRSGAGKPAVVHTRFTSRPGASAVSGLQSHTRPSSSVTRRDAIVGVSLGFDRETATGDGLREPHGGNRDSTSRERHCRLSVSLVTHSGSPVVPATLSRLYTVHYAARVAAH